MFLIFLLSIAGLAAVVFGLLRAEAAAVRRRPGPLMAIHQTAVEVLAAVIDARDSSGSGRAARVQACSLELASGLRLSRSDGEALRVAALLSAADDDALTGVKVTDPVLPILRHYAERWDGSGEPERLRGEAIPPAARILAVADAFDALTSGRSGSRRSAAEACIVIESRSGIDFDPRVVAVLRDRRPALEAAGAAAGESAAPLKSASQQPVSRVPTVSGTEEPSRTDDLTNLPGADHLLRVFERESLGCRESGEPLALLEMDLDRFRAINDRHGHAAGDLYLRQVARVLRSHLRERDLLVRLGGDRFAALLPLTGFAAATLLAERLQLAVDSFRLKPAPAVALRAGLSFGLSIYPYDATTLARLQSRAGDNLSRNKRSRRRGRAGSSSNIVPFPVVAPGGGR